VSTRKDPASAEPMLTTQMRSPSTGGGLSQIDPVSGSILSAAIVRSGSGGLLVGVGEASCVGVAVGGCVAVAVGTLVGMGDAVDVGSITLAAVGVGVFVGGAWVAVAVGV